jgi:hypothetical protein
MLMLSAYPASAGFSGSRVGAILDESNARSDPPPEAPRALPIVTHPLAPQDGPNPDYSGHYYVGSVYGGGSTTSTDLQVQLAVPDDVGQLDSLYYVLLSVWDNAGSYDQIGLANFHGAWGLAYSWTSPCAGEYYYSPDVLNLQAGLTYLFEMQIASGVVAFSARYSTNSTVVWSLNAPTGGTQFEVQGYYSCDSVTNFDYTDYEEVYDSPGALVPYDFWFTSNEASGSAVTSWNAWSSTDSPPSATTGISGSSVTIENEPYYLVFPTSPSGPMDSTSVEAYSEAQTFGWAFSVQSFTAGDPVSLEENGEPSGWTVSCSPNYGDAPISSEVYFTIPANESAGTYSVEINATAPTGGYDQIALTVVVAPELTLSLRATPGSGLRDAGQEVEFDSGAEGGMGPYTVDWVSLPSGCSTQNQSTLTCEPNSAGVSLVDVTVTDSHGYYAAGSVTYVVDPDPSVRLTVLSGHASVGSSLTLFALVTGGSGGFSYEWDGLPGCGSSITPELNCTPSRAGSFTISVTVHDSNGGFGSYSMTVSVEQTLLGLPLASGLALIGTLACGCVVAIALVTYRRSRRARTLASPATRVSSFGVSASGVPIGGFAVRLDPTCQHCGCRMPEGARYCGVCAVPLNPQ